MRCKARKADDGCWVEGYYVESRGQTFIHDYNGDTWSIDRESMCRDTKLATPEGIRIWENDILSYKETQGTVCFGVYNGQHYGCYVNWDDNGLLRKDICYWLPKVKIIGNAKEITN